MSAVVQALEAAARFAVVDIVVKGTVALLCAWLIARCLVRASAATRHAAWVLAFAALAAVPLAGPLLPGWVVAVPESVSRVLLAPVPGESSRAGTGAVSGATTARPEIPAPAAPAADAELGSDGGGATAFAAADRPVSARPAGLFGRSAAAPVVGLVYLAGCLALLLRLAVHIARARGIARRGVAADGAIRSAVPSGRAARALPARARVLLSPEVDGPLTFGVLRPVVLLPASAVEWPLERVRAALLHEAAHVQRRDAAVHLLVRALCVLYWPNPLVRRAARRQALEQERACDDRAIGAGIDAHEYASQLVALARAGVARRRLAHALPIGGNGLRERVRGILDPGAVRGALSRPRVIVAALGLAAALAPVAALQLHGRGRTAAPPWIHASGEAPARAGIQDDADVRALAHADPRIRARAAWSLGERELRAAVDPLSERLGDEDPAVRTVAAWALGEIKDRRATSALLGALASDGDPVVRELAALALGEIRDPRAAAPLAAAFDDDADLDVASAALWALQRIDAPTAKARAPRRAAVRPWPDLDREPARFPHGRSGDAPADAGDALTALASADAAVRAHAAWSLGIAGDTAAVEPLLRRLRDADPFVRAAAIWALDEINPSRRSRARSDRT